MSKTKIKSHKGAAKRFKKTASGFKFRNANRNHILTKKAKSRKRRLRGLSRLDDSHMRAVKKMLEAYV